MALEVGSRLGHYRILALLGRGGMADVYRAEDERLGREVALKAVPPEFARDPERIERFRREVRAVAKLSHRNIVTVYEYGKGEGLHFYTMELMPGGHLKARIQAHPEGMPAAEARAVVLAVARALEYAHRRGFAHRDVKPENILFGEDGTPQLTDFGIARAMSEATRMTATGMSIGSPHYMSPEQAQGIAVDGRSDLYSLGVVLYEMLTGQLPFDGPDTFAVGLSHIQDPVPALPPRLSDWQPVLDRLLAKSPQDRYRSAGDLVEVLEAGGRPQVPVTRIAPVERELDPATRFGGPVVSLPEKRSTTQDHAMLAALVGILLALAAVGMCYVVLQDSRRPSGSTSNGDGDDGEVQNTGKRARTGRRRRERLPAVRERPVRARPSETRSPGPVLDGRARLVVETSPPGAEDPVDGTRVGETPLRRSDIRAGAREITLRHSHYENVLFSDDFAPGNWSKWTTVGKGPGGGSPNPGRLSIVDGVLRIKATAGGNYDLRAVKEIFLGRRYGGYRLSFDWKAVTRETPWGLDGVRLMFYNDSGRLIGQLVAVNSGQTRRGGNVLDHVLSRSLSKHRQAGIGKLAETFDWQRVTLSTSMIPGMDSRHVARMELRAWVYNDAGRGGEMHFDNFKLSTN